MIPFISLEEAKMQVHVLNSDHDADIELKIGSASAILMRYIKKSTVPDEWIVNASPITYDIPEDVKHVTQLIFSELYFNREASVADILSPAVVSLLSTYWDPAIA